jgi:hypothetical protein
MSIERDSSFPPPSRRRRVFDTTWGRDREGGMAEPLPSGFPPPLAPPHKGEGDRSRKWERTLEARAACEVAA